MSAWIKVIRTLTNRAIPPGQQHLVTCHYAGDLTALLHSTSKGFSISTFYYHFPSPTPSCACILTCVHVCICACTHLSPPLHSCLCHHPYTPRTSHEKRLPSSTELGRGRAASPPLHSQYRLLKPRYNLARMYKNLKTVLVLLSYHSIST